MTNVPVLNGERIVLRPARSGDVAERLALGRDPDIMRVFGVDPTGVPPLTDRSARRWVEGLMAHPHAWVVEHNCRLLREVRLDGLDLHDARAWLAIGLYDPAKLGMGLGREVVRLVLTHAFDTLGLHRISVRVVAYNTRAIRCHMACGFVVEGREREAALVGSERHDDIIMGILAHEMKSTADDNRIDEPA
jgi:[ribosomal protein S5]-alanine N-acetyltransferase